MQQNPILVEVWKQFCQKQAEAKRLYGEGYNLYAEGDKLHTEGPKLNVEGNKLRAEGDKLNAEGSKLWAEGEIAWYSALIEVHCKSVKYDWLPDGSCKLANGEVYKSLSAEELATT